MIVNLIRESDVSVSCEAAGVPAHRVGVQSAESFDLAEREVRRRVLRTLADRESPPTAVVFVRTWEAIDLGAESMPETEPEVPVRVDVSAAQVEAPPRRGRRAKA